MVNSGIFIKPYENENIITRLENFDYIHYIDDEHIEVCLEFSFDELPFIVEMIKMLKDENK